MLVTTYKCPKCNQVIYARNKYDIHTCFCGAINCQRKIIDTNYQYSNIEESTMQIPVTQEALNQDFYYNGGKYGTIKEVKNNGKQ